MASPVRSQGRPRVGTSPQPTGSAAEQILDAAARNFVQSGFEATSTRTIAAAVGLRQASLYYHFASKQEMLAELLARTVRPSLAAAERLLTAPGSAAGRLHALVSFDCSLLLTSAYNIGALYLLPEVREERFAQFRADRRRLREAYHQLISEVLASTGPDGASGPPPDILSDLVFGLVESVIALRGAGAELDSGRLLDGVGIAALRILGLPAGEITRAVAESRAL
ncbi:TetR/AcrR family transcriptional regulator [Pengzhenrongella sp.]|uniref:TetR/AcrR family transcriptional regulator n=1 Tax=Pengzhenrongella sp. TaxID=2888820 RepID=UPI002F92868E